MLPQIDLRMLRACLLMQQRKWCKAGASTERCPPDTAAYLDALLAGIRRDIGA